MTWDPRFTSLPQDVIPRIFTLWKTHQPRPNLNPRTSDPRDHQGRWLHWERTSTNNINTSDRQTFPQSQFNNREPLRMPNAVFGKTGNDIPQDHNVQARKCLLTHKGYCCFFKHLQFIGEYSEPYIGNISVLVKSLQISYSDIYFLSIYFIPSIAVLFCLIYISWVIIYYYYCCWCWWWWCCCSCLVFRRRSFVD